MVDRRVRLRFQSSESGMKIGNKECRVQSLCFGSDDVGGMIQVDVELSLNLSGQEDVDVGERGRKKNCENSKEPTHRSLRVTNGHRQETPILEHRLASRMSAARALVLLLGHQGVISSRARTIAMITPASAVATPFG